MSSNTNDTITAVRGIEVGHCTDARRPTGCSVVLARAGATGGVDVRGAAPGTRETDLLAPGNLVETVHAVLLSGGSAWGLDAASGVMRWLERRGIGLPTGTAPGSLVPIVPAAVLFDLPVGDARIRPDAEAGYAACEAASSAPVPQGSVGAGAGASVGKLFGMERAMKSGIGSATVCVGGVTVGALIAVNALGDVREGSRPIAGARRSAESRELLDATAAALAGEAVLPGLSGTNTTIGVIATDAALPKARCMRLAGAGHDGLARAIAPIHTMSDGDTLFALATGKAGEAPAADFNVLCLMAAEAVERACQRAVRAVRSVRLPDGLWLPGLGDTSSDNT